MAASILLGLWCVLFFAALFAPPLLDDADATHAQAARWMAQTGDLVTLHVDGVRYLEKAPLLYWLAAASFRIFGYNTFAAHLPQALAVLLLMLLGHRWANQAFGARTGFYTALGVLTCTGVFLFTRIMIPEVWLSLTLAAALFAFLKSLGSIAAKPRAPFLAPLSHAMSASAPNVVPAAEQPAIAWYAGPLFYPAVMWASLALAVLAKGLVALVFFFATTLLFLLLTDTLKDVRKLRPLAGLLLFFSIAAPWHVLAGLRNTGGAGGHGFFWFYFVNEHWLRFLGRRQPADYNKLPGYLYWAMHLVWLFPWSLFLPLGIIALVKRERHQNTVLTGHLKTISSVLLAGYLLPIMLIPALHRLFSLDLMEMAVLALGASSCWAIVYRRRRAGLTLSPFHRIDPQQRTILLLALFAAIVLLFFSLSTNQEYYTFPAYLPLLLLMAATLTRAEQTYSSSPEARRWIGLAHAAFAAAGGAIAITLLYGLWVSRHQPYLPDIGTLLAHRAVGDYTLSMSHVFDLTTASFAALRLPATLATITFALGPALAWMLRTQRRHLSATTAMAFTAAGFLFAAQLAFARFAPMLSSASFAATIARLAETHRIAPETQVLIYGDQAFGSSLVFYRNDLVGLVDGRTTSMHFGSTFADAPPVFLTHVELLEAWGHGARKLLFVPAERRDEVNALLMDRQVVLDETSGKVLVTDRPLDADGGRP